jgi:phosphomannomutase
MRNKQFPVSGERNFKVEGGQSAIARVEAAYISKGEISKLDGLAVDMGSWRFNLRASNTEPLLRLNVESRGNRKLCMDKAEEIISIIKDD